MFIKTETWNPTKGRWLDCEYHAARVPKKVKHKKFQVNLHFSKSQFSACGYGRAYFSHTLQGLIAKIKHGEQIQTDQIILTFQPE